MKEMRAPEGRGQAPNQPPFGHPHTGRPPAPPASGNAGPQMNQQGRPPYPQRDPDRDPGNVTLFRTGNFFVHAFTALQKTGLLPRASGEATLIERIQWISFEKQRLMAAQTRLLPQIEAINMAQQQEIMLPAWVEAIGVALVLGIILFVQAFNIFNFPAYKTDEGTSMANAWAILHGDITPYTYTYDHPPLGWVQIAFGTLLTGGITSFGNAINTGRILMLVLAAASSLCVYLITSRLSGSRSAALLATVLYSLSPLSLIYRDQVLLDNIATFWLLLSLCLITTGKSNLRTFVIAAAALGFAVLTREIFIIFIPVLLFAIWLYATPFQRKFSLVAFIYVSLAVASAYVLLAIMKGEFLPSGVPQGDPGWHPSLIETLLQQLQAPLPAGQFSAVWTTWTQTDIILLFAGIIAMFVNILIGTANRFQLLAALFAATYCTYLLLSNMIYPYSIVPLLPFLAINIALLFNTPLRWLTRKIGFDLMRATLLFILIGMLIPTNIQQAMPLREKNLAGPQQQALLWLRDNVPCKSVVITDSYLFSDLREHDIKVCKDKAFKNKALSDDPSAPHTHIYTNAALDPAIASGELKGDWQKINYLVVDTTMLKTIRSNNRYALLNQALHHAILRVEFGSRQDGSLIQIYQVIAT